jgi:hypothetical protein
VCCVFHIKIEHCVDPNCFQISIIEMPIAVRVFGSFSINQNTVSNRLLASKVALQRAGCNFQTGNVILQPAVGVFESEKPSYNVQGAFSRSEKPPNNLQDVFSESETLSRNLQA